MVLCGLVRFSHKLPFQAIDNARLIRKNKQTIRIWWSSSNRVRMTASESWRYPPFRLTERMQISILPSLKRILRRFVALRCCCFGASSAAGISIPLR